MGLAPVFWGWECTFLASQSIDRLREQVHAEKGTGYSQYMQ